MALRVAARVEADASGFKRGVNDAQQSMERFGRTANDTAANANRALGDMGASARRMQESVNRTGHTMALMERETARAMTLSRQQLQTLQYTAADVAASLASGASPLMILMQQGGQVAQVFPGIVRGLLGIGGAAVVVGGGMGAVAARMSDISGQARELETVLGALGNKANVTAEQLRDMVNAARGKGVSGAEAYEAALSLARGGRVGAADLFREIMDIAPDVAAVLGTSMPDAAEAMADAFAKGAAGVEKLDEELRFLTAEQVRQIRTMEEHGDRAGALGVAVDALQGRFSGAAEKMRSDWGQAMHDMAFALDMLIERIANSDPAQILARGFSRIGRGLSDALAEPGIAEQIVAANRELIEAEGRLAAAQQVVTNTGGLIGNRRVADARAEVERLRSEVDALVEQARAAAAEADAPPALATAGMSEGEHKRIDRLREELEAERAALALGNREREIRVAGLQAERAALEAGRSPEAAKAERLIAEERARMNLNAAMGETFEGYSREIDMLQRSAAAQGRIAAATLVSVAAGQKAEQAWRIEQATMEERIALSTAYGEEAARLIEIINAKTAAIVANDNAERARNVADLIAGKRQEIELAKLELSAMGQSATARRLVMAQQDAINDLRARGIDVTGQLTDEERELAQQYLETTRQAEQVAAVVEQYEALAREAEDVFLRAFDRIGGDVCEFPAEIAAAPEVQALFLEALNAE